MKFLFFTDDHKRGTSPERRKDNFPETLAKKLAEVVRIAREREVDFVLHGGDFFDSPAPALSVCAEFLPILGALEVPLYVVAGNHDLYAHNFETFGRTMLGLLVRLGFVRLLTLEPLYLRKDGLCVQLTGKSYNYDIDQEDKPIAARGYLVKKAKECDFAVHVVHGMLLPRPFPAKPYTLLEEVFPTEADLTLAGHFHVGFPEVEHQGKYFFNPGALVRLSGNPGELKRQVQVLLFDLSGGKLRYEKIPLATALPATEVLDVAQLSEASFREEKLASFLASVRSSAGYARTDIREIILKIAHEKELEPEVREEALRRISLAEEALRNRGVGL